MEPSTSRQSTSKDMHLSQIKHTNEDVFGVPSDLSTNYLPTHKDVLQYYFFLFNSKLASNRLKQYKSFTSNVTDKIIEIWSKLPIRIIQRTSILNKLNRFIERYKNRTKHENTPQFTEFVDSLKEIFNVSHCACDLQNTECSCGNFPAQFRRFIIDQYNDRMFTINDFIQLLPPPSVDTQATTLVTAQTEAGGTDRTYELDDNMVVEEEGNGEGRERPSSSLSRHFAYTPRYNTPNFAMECDRYGISDEAAASLASALLKDMDIKDENDKLIIMDRNKVRRERFKCRENILRKRLDRTCLEAFSFDGRKDDTFTLEKIDEKLHPRMVKQPHLVILREPGSTLLGYANLTEENANAKCNSIIAFFDSLEISLNDLAGVCCDGEPTNTGVENGVIIRLEKHLGRSLHWFICLLHFNELPFIHLYNKLEKSITKGPSTTTGTLAAQIQDCEKLKVHNTFY